MSHKKFPSHGEIMMGREITFGLNNPIMVSSDKVGLVCDRENDGPSSVRHLLTLGSHLEILIRESKLFHELKRVFLIVKS
jgi:hypothetical protein